MAATEPLELLQLELQGLSAWPRIVAVALPAIAMNAAPPIMAAVQTALLGRLACTEALAAFAAVGLCVGFMCRVFNFLVDGVSSKVGRCVGQRDWAQLATHVRLSMRWSLALGAAAVPLLLAARAPLCNAVLALSGDVQRQAAPYWLLRSLLVPVQMVAMAATGVLQGFGHVRVNAALTTTAALLEMGGSAFVLLLRQANKQEAQLAELSANAISSDLFAMGLVTCACQTLLAAGALACIAALPPAGAPARVDLRQAVGWRSAGGGSAQEPLLADGEHADDARQPRRASGLLDATTKEFLSNGRDMFLRSMVLQLTFFIALAAASRLGTTMLAAHSIIGTLWVMVSYAVDGFAAAGIVLGSRLHGFAQDPHLHSDAKRSMALLTQRVLLAGGLAGAAAGLAFQLAAAPTIALFTADPAVAAALHGGGAWLVLVLAQPLNGLLFVFDGLLLATQSFAFIRDYMAAGFAAVFCPLLAAGMWLRPGLAVIWGAKLALNVWRLGGAGFLIFRRFLPRFGGEVAGAAAAQQPDQ